MREEDIKYIHELEERVQELEKELQYQHDRKHINADEIKKLQEQNEQYRKALEQIYENWTTAPQSLSGEILAHRNAQLARKALGK